MASDPQESASVFDVLYADIARLSSLISQLADDGILTEITRAAEDATSTDVGVSVKIIKGGTSSNAKESTSRKIDPRWLLPLTFLDLADE